MKRKAVNIAAAMIATAVTVAAIVGCALIKPVYSAQTGFFLRPFMFNCDGTLSTAYDTVSDRSSEVISYCLTQKVLNSFNSDTAGKLSREYSPDELKDIISVRKIYGNPQDDLWDYIIFARCENRDDARTIASGLIAAAKPVIVESIRPDKFEITVNDAPAQKEFPYKQLVIIFAALAVDISAIFIIIRNNKEKEDTAS